MKARAAELVKQLRGGADFCTLAAAYTERPATNGQKPCKIGLFAIPDLRPDIAGAIKDVIAAGVSDPLKTDEGYQILKVDARNAGSKWSYGSPGIARHNWPICNASCGASLSGFLSRRFERNRPSGIARQPSWPTTFATIWSKDLYPRGPNRAPIACESSSAATGSA